MTVDRMEGSTFTVLEGRDGWLFLDTSDDFEVLRLYTDPSYVQPDVINAWRVALGARREYFQSLGITHLTVIAPGAHLVYPEALPDGIELSGQSPYTMLDKVLDEPTAAEVLYLLDPLVAARGESPTFMQTDSHWTDWGAFAGYQATMRQLATMRSDIHILEEGGVEWSTRQVSGALGAVMPEPRSEVVRVGEVRDSQCRWVNHVTNEKRDAYMLMEQDRPDLPSAVIFRDSGMTNAHKFFSESFRRVAYSSHPNAVFRDLIEREKPDIVITVMGERRLFKPPRDATIDDFRSMFGDLLMPDRDAMTAQLNSRTLLRKGDFSGALAENERALRAGVNARLLMHRSTLYRALGDSTAAWESLRGATLADPTDGPIWLAYGQFLQSINRHDEAVVAYVRATEVEPQHPVLWGTAIRGLLEAGHVDKAVERGAMAVDLHPTDATVRYAHGWALADGGALEESAEELRAAISLAPHVIDYRRKLASVLIQLRRWVEAEMVLEDLVAEDPDEPEYAMWLGRARESLGMEGSA